METTRDPSELDFCSLRSAMPHPLGSQARVLLTSVFSPYAQDDEYGSRVINPMELYHNQVTRCFVSTDMAVLPKNSIRQLYQSTGHT